MNIILIFFNYTVHELIQFGDGVLGASGEVLREKSGVRDRLSGYCIVASLFSPSVPK